MTTPLNSVSAGVPSSPSAVVSSPSRRSAPHDNVNSLLSKVRSALSITEYIGRYVTLKQGSGESSGKCPFHGDNNPSFSVSESKGLFHCKGCGEAGNVVQFYAKLNEVSISDALKTLAKELGIYRETPLPAPLKLIDIVSRRYQEALRGNADATAYLKGRSLKPETLERFGIGYCTGDEFARAGKEALEEAVNAGVLSPSKMAGWKPYNLMTNRVTFTIRNKEGRVVGFGGRQMDDTKSGPKYINTHETEYFKKSELLFGLFEARSGIYREKHAIVVEGYMDTAILHQEGLNNAVAVMGASASEAAFESLWALTDRLVFCLDGDRAGRTGTLRSIMQAASLMKDDSRIDIAHMPDGTDPDEFVLAHGAEAFRKLCEAATPLSRFLCESTLDSEQETKGLFSLRVAEDRARYLSLMQEVAAKFFSAPALQLEIQREAHATINAFVIDAALRQRNINASAQEIQAALLMMAPLLAEQLAAQAFKAAAIVIPASMPAPAVLPSIAAAPVIVEAPAKADPVLVSEPQAVRVLASTPRVASVIVPPVEAPVARRMSLFKA